MSGTTEKSTGTALVPQGFNEAVRFAELMAKSKMIPKEFRGHPEECLVIIEQAMRWEMSPYAVIQCAGIIHDKPMYSGTLVAAVVNARGPAYGLQGRLHYDYTKSGEERTVTVWGVLDGRKEKVEIVLKNAMTENAQWKKQADQQLAYHGSRVWARRHMPELMLGVYSPEEFDRNSRPVAEPPFNGVTIDAGEIADEVASEMNTPEPNDDIGPEPTWLEQLDEKLSSEPNGTKWLKLLDAEVSHVPTKDDAESIGGLASIAAAYTNTKTPTMIKARINDILRKAIAKFDDPETKEADYMDAEPGEVA